MTLRSLVLVSCLLTLSSCTGSVRDVFGFGGGSGDGEQRLAPQSRVLRLTHEQYERSALALLGLGAADQPTDGFIADNGAGSYGTDATNLRVGEALYGDYERAAWRLAGRVTEDAALRTALGADEPATFVGSFVGRCLRGRADSGAISLYQSVYDTCSASGPNEGVRCVVAACLQDPEFIYRLELGGAAEAGTQPLTGVERASRLAFLLTGGPPDEELVVAATGGQLDSREGVLEAVERLRAGGDATNIVAAFHDGWLGLDGLENGFTRSSERFPDLPANAGPAIRAELLRFVTAVAESGGGLREILLDRRAIVDRTTAALYGVDVELAGDSVDARFEIEDFTYEQSDGACAPVNGFANLCSVASTVALPVEVASAGPHRVVLRAYATQSGPEVARAFVDVDGARTEMEITSAASAPTTHEVEVDLTGDAHTITIGLVADHRDTTLGTDRNLFVDYLEVRSDGGGVAEVMLPETERAGLLTRLAFAALHADERSTSPILRGAWIVRNLQCVEIEPPSEAVPPLPGEDSAMPITMRERVARHTHEGVCATCHISIINPPGFALERYDAIGRYVETDFHGLSIDSAVVLTLGQGTADVADGVALSETLADQSEPYECYVRNWMNYLYGRAVTTGDHGLARYLAEQMRAGELDINGLVLELIGSDGFLRRSERLMEDAETTGE